ncbi:hypothetical protein [Escherichia albertii]|uniref:hypothetical protein n=1 Tax=Escherichia albertii TaxID=208962 RepID=UPI001856587F|nr:hypothetical protein [Escherichia albertii]MCZ8550403.1 hypothetical protein [Escherichia albertii]MCZ9157632.1 hypothetical protein [Escherichia albertii]WDB24904.1 hypothetical protein PS035_01700 [Escherichia albertii]WDC11651.1 hypothetical protein PS040_01660 [Escherichia albertii]
MRAIASQTNMPVNSVDLATLVNINTIITNFQSGPYHIGSNAVVVGNNGLVNMSARYVRTDGNIVGGLANASIEIQAAYE